ncbi:MAG TPA: type II CAAX endopeptidase family protein [Amaricoccus sp.]|nr:type II CAAX endopeptidase family protein [Amaricoccus sp.]
MPLSPAFEAFVAPARARPGLWRLAAGTLLAAAAWLAGIFLIVPLALNLPADPARALLLGYLLSFTLLGLALALAARLLQRRPAATLLGPGGFRPRQFALGVGVIALLALLSAPFVAMAALPVRQLPLALWAAWLPLALPALFLQSAAEELAFRGWLMQGLAARFRSPWVWLLLPALLFGLLHWNPAEFGSNAWLVVLSTAVAGLVLADVTLRSGNLSAAIGLHFANNVSALLVVSLPSPLAAFSLLVAGVDPGDAAAVRPLLLADLALMLAAWALWRALHRGGRAPRG